MRNRTGLRLLLAGCGAMLAGGVWAQDGAPVPSPAPHFDYFWVQASPPDQDARYCTTQNGQEQCTNASMLTLIAAAYGVTPDKVFGGPDWLNHNLYNLRARAAGAPTPQQMQQMLQAALAGYFGLKTHMDQRPMPAFALTLGKSKLKLKPAADPGQTPACKRPPPTASAVPPAPGSPPVRAPFFLDCTSVSMEDLVGLLPKTSAQLDLNHPLVDRTGLTGKYDFELHFYPRTALRQPNDPGYDPDVDISLFSAFQNLGLKLAEVREPAPVVVIDAVNPAVLTDAAHPMSPRWPTEFEVADIKPVEKPTPQMRSYRVTPGGEVDVCCYSLQLFITDAYNFDPQHIGNAPPWLNSDSWSLQAKTEPGTLVGDLDPMLQNMLKTRFGLVMHDDMQPRPVYSLRLEGQPKLTRNTAGGVSNCTVSRGDDGVNLDETCTNVTMAQFADKLYTDMMPSYFDHPVVDLTGLTGTWDFKLKCASARFVGIIPAGLVFPPGASLPPPNPVAISCFDALKRLGLKTAPDKQPIAVKVIDHVDRTPTGN